MTEVQDQKPLPSLKREEFLALFSPEIHDKIQAKALESGIEGIFAIQGAELYTEPGAGEMVGIQYGPISTFKFSDLHLNRLVPSPRGGSLMYSMIAHCPRSEFESTTVSSDCFADGDELGLREITLQGINRFVNPLDVIGQVPTTAIGAIEGGRLTSSKVDGKPGQSTDPILSDEQLPTGNDVYLERDAANRSSRLKRGPILATDLPVPPEKTVHRSGKATTAARLGRSSDQIGSLDNFQVPTDATALVTGILATGNPSDDSQATEGSLPFDNTVRDLQAVPTHVGVNRRLGAAEAGSDGGHFQAASDKSLQLGSGNTVSHNVTHNPLESEKTRVKDFPILYKRTSGGATQTWRTWVEATPHGTGVIHTEFGLQGGKLQHLSEEIVTGKNIGKRNETTPLQQAEAEAEAEWKKQLERKGYGRDVEQSAATRGASPMLAHPLDKVKPDQIDWTHAWAQPKLDGFRCIIDFAGGGLTMRSREGKPIAADMSHIGNALTAALKNRQVPNRFSIDGELYRHRTFRTDKPLGEATKEEKSQHFQDLASAIKKTGPFTPLVELHVYDVMDPYPFKLRTKWVHETLANIPGIVLVETTQVQSLDSMMAYQGACLVQGYEGAMLRHGATQSYDFGKRSKHLLKVKTFKDDEFNVYDVRQGRGTHKGMAIFICETKAGATFEVTAPGTHWQKQQYWLHKPQCIGHKLTVKFFEYTGGDAPVPRFPVALRFREGDPFDMPPEPETQK